MEKISYEANAFKQQQQIHCEMMITNAKHENLPLINMNSWAGAIMIICLNHSFFAIIIFKFNALRRIIPFDRNDESKDCEFTLLGFQFVYLNKFEFFILNLELKDSIVIIWHEKLNTFITKILTVVTKLTERFTKNSNPNILRS